MIKVGDTVICVDDKDYGAVYEGKEYEVLELGPDEEEIQLGGTATRGFPYDECDFKKVTKKVTEPLKRKEMKMSIYWVAKVEKDGEGGKITKAVTLDTIVADSHNKAIAKFALEQKLSTTDNVVAVKLDYKEMD